MQKYVGICKQPGLGGDVDSLVYSECQFLCCKYFLHDCQCDVFMRQIGKSTHHELPSTSSKKLQHTMGIINHLMIKSCKISHLPY